MTVGALASFAAEVERLGAQAPWPLLVDKSNPYEPEVRVWRALRKMVGQRIAAIAYYAPTAMAFMAAELLRDQIVKEVEHVEVFAHLEDAEDWIRGFADVCILPPPK